MQHSRVTDLHRALAELRTIRGQLALGTEFRGYGPATVAVTGALACLAAELQQRWVPDPLGHLSRWLVLWVVTAAVSLSIITIEAVLRSRRVHAVLAMEMVREALEQFLPPLVAGLLLTVVLVCCAEHTAWMLPGLWQIIFSLGVFASCRFLPRPIFGVGVWYLAAGLLCLVSGARGHQLAAWSMGIPFGVGQVLVAVVLRFGYRQMDAHA